MPFILEHYIPVRYKTWEESPDKHPNLVHSLQQRNQPFTITHKVILQRLKVRVISHTRSHSKSQRSGSYHIQGHIVNVKGQSYHTQGNTAKVKSQGHITHKVILQRSKVRVLPHTRSYSKCQRSVLAHLCVIITKKLHSIPYPYNTINPFRVILHTRSHKRSYSKGQRLCYKEERSHHNHFQHMTPC